ncbi:MAG: FmdB family zinc ribbon protein [Beutenbergiaceae bacterium]
MPTYSYACTDCGHRFDIYQAFTEDALHQCPECGGVLRKQFGNVGVVFKGSGFYRNDARNTKSSSDTAPAGKDGRSSGSDAAPKADGKTDSGKKESSTAGKSTTSSGSASSSTAAKPSNPAP